MPIINPRPAFLAIALLVAVIAPACGGSAGPDAGADRPSWPWDVQPNVAPDSAAPALLSDVVKPIDGRAAADAPADRAPSTDGVTANNGVDAATEDAPINLDNAADAQLLDGSDDLSAPGTGDLCADGYACLAGCENRCGLHNLGRSVCTCTASTLRCSDCILNDLARPQVPQVVAATCGNGIATDVSCARAGDACFVHPDWPYPDGCLCWPTTLGMLWDCAPVFDWFSPPPGAGAAGTGAAPSAR